MENTALSGVKIRTASYGKNEIDIPFLIIVLLLVVAGLIVLFSASYASAYYNYGDSYYFIKNQAVFALMGLAVMTLIILFATRKIYIFATLPIAGISIILLALVPFIGTTVNGAKRWIRIAGISIQPSEIAKIAIVFVFALMIAIFKEKMEKPKYGILPFAVVLLVFAGLVIIEKHVSATVIICGIAAIMLFVGGVKLVYFIAIGAIGVAGIGGLILVSDHALARVKVWLDPWVDPLGKGFQSIQSLYAIGSGGIFGLGLGQSRQKYLYIPEPQNDFIFSIATEELGFFGAIIIIALFALLIWRGYIIALRTNDRFMSMLVVGLISKFALQVLFNIAVVTGTIPNTGISLPFFSYGGTALVLQLAEMGVILSVSKYSRSEKE